jgi:hypothetical protein
MPVTTRSQKNGATAPTTVAVTSGHPMTTRSRAASATATTPKRMSARLQQKQDIETVVAKILVSMRYRG